MRIEQLDRRELLAGDLGMLQVVDTAEPPAATACEFSTATVAPATADVAGASGVAGLPKPQVPGFEAEPGPNPSLPGATAQHDGAAVTAETPVAEVDAPLESVPSEPSGPAAALRDSAQANRESVSARVVDSNPEVLDVQEHAGTPAEVRACPVSVPLEVPGLSPGNTSAVERQPPSLAEWNGALAEQDLTGPAAIYGPRVPDHFREQVQSTLETSPNTGPAETLGEGEAAPLSTSLEAARRKVARVDFVNALRGSAVDIIIYDRRGVKLYEARDIDYHKGIHTPSLPKQVRVKLIVRLNGRTRRLVADLKAERTNSGGQPYIRLVLGKPRVFPGRMEVKVPHGHIVRAIRGPWTEWPV